MHTPFQPQARGYVAAEAKIPRAGIGDCPDCRLGARVRTSMVPRLPRSAQSHVRTPTFPSHRQPCRPRPGFDFGRLRQRSTAGRPGSVAPGRSCHRRRQPQDAGVQRQRHGQQLWPGLATRHRLASAELLDADPVAGLRQRRLSRRLGPQPGRAQRRRRDTADGQRRGPRHRAGTRRVRLEPQWRQRRSLTRSTGQPVARPLDFAARCDQGRAEVRRHRQPSRRRRQELLGRLVQRARPAAGHAADRRQWPRQPNRFTPAQPGAGRPGCLDQLQRLARRWRRGALPDAHQPDPGRLAGAGPERDRSQTQRCGGHQRARCGAQRQRTRRGRARGRWRLVHRWRLAQQRGGGDEQPFGADRIAAGRWPRRCGDGRGQAPVVGQADPHRDQFAPPLRPCRRPARGGGRGRDADHQRPGQALLRARLRQPQHLAA